MRTAVLSRWRQKIKNKLPAPYIIIFIIAVFAGSCGLETINYLENIDSNNIHTAGNNHVEIGNLPVTGSTPITKVTLDFTSGSIPTITSTGLSIFHDHYELFYRIYISNTLLTSIPESAYSTVNPTLASDFSSLKPYTVPENYYAASIASAFSSRNYYSIDKASNPNLLRSSRLITPKPANKYFFNDPELKADINLNSNNNADVVRNSAGSRYTYVSIYAAQSAFDTTTLTPYYSTATHLGVFLLPDTIYTIPVTLVSITPSGSPTTTALTLRFDQDIPGLVKEDIVLTDNPPVGISATTLAGPNAGHEYVLSVAATGSGLTQITVALNKAGYNLAMPVPVNANF